MNKKGFTLVELLAVIIILSLLAIIANNSVTNVVSNSKSDLYDAQIKLIETAAQNWGADNLNKLPGAGMCSYITLKDLKHYGILEKEVINPKTNEKFSDELIIKITSKSNSKGELISNYEVDPNNINGCVYVYVGIETCTLVSDADFSGTITAGDKYNCKVKENMEPGYLDGYTFYVLTTPLSTDTTVNLIMNQNINSDGTPAGTTKVTQETNSSQYNVVAWNISGSNIEGPVTAMDFLNEATKDWVNVNKLTINLFYDTAGNEYEMTEYNTYARLPIYSSDPSKTEITDFKEDNSNLYLYDVFAVGDICGYWTLSASSGTSQNAWVVDVAKRKIRGPSVKEKTNGVRPVITVSQRFLSD